LSEQNVEILRAAWAAYADGDIAEMLKNFDADLVAQRWPPLPDPAIYRGPDGFLQLVTDWIEDFEEFETSAEEYIDANDRQVINRVRQKAVGAASGVPIKAEFWFVWTLKDLRIVRADLYLEREQALEATGLEDR
jgi:ketosteroid isomerase-like protein